MANINLMPKLSSRNAPNYLDKLKIEAKERKRNILYLIMGYLKEHMYNNTAETLIKEAQLDNNYQLCENVELDIILQEYQSYYYTKFQKYPKIIRKLDETEQKHENRSAKRGKSAKRSTATPVPPRPKNDSPSESDIDFQFEIVSLNGATSSNDQIIPQTIKTEKSKPFVPELENYTSENKELINQISSQVITQQIDIKWTDCLGLYDVIEVLKESSIYPLQYPELFKDSISWKGVLLHGPPGTGKTMLAKALASEGHTTFFNVTSSTFISKWRGESEKMIKYLFDLAKFHSPSTIFFDEIDALITGIKDTQHEASKRFKSELLVQLDGISSTESQIFVLASTNSPWDLDHALLRRFDKRVLVDMPNKEARIQMLKHRLKHINIKMSLEEFDEFGTLTDHYSGSDIKCLSKEVTMSVVREKIKSLKSGNKNTNTRLITFSDIKLALQKIRPATSNSICKKYYQWQNEHGAF